MVFDSTLVVGLDSIPLAMGVVWHRCNRFGSKHSMEQGLLFCWGKHTKGPQTVPLQAVSYEVHAFVASKVGWPGAWTYEPRKCPSSQLRCGRVIF